MTQGDEFNGFFVAHYGPLVRMVRVVVGDLETAEDVAQEALLEVYRSWRRVSRYDKPEAWLRKVAFRQARRVQRRRFLLSRLAPRLQNDGSEAESTGSDMTVTATAINKLSYSQRVAIALFYLEDQSVQEIAETLGCSTSTAKVHLHRGRTRLRRELEEVDDE